MTAPCAFGAVWGVKQCAHQRYKDQGAACLWCHKLRNLHPEDSGGVERLRQQWLSVIDRHIRMCELWMDKD